MNNSKLINILCSFTKKDAKEFSLYIHSPLFNKNRDVLNLLSILEKFYPDFQNKNLNHNFISIKLLGRNDVPKLRYTMTDLTRLAEDFIALKDFESNKQLHLAKAYLKRNLPKQFNQEVDRQKLNFINKSEIRDDEFYNNKHNLCELEFQHTLQHDNRNIDTQLQEVVDNLDLFYLSKKLKYSCEIINRMNILKVSYNVNLLENLLGYLENNSFNNSPPIVVYHQALKTLQNPDIENNYHHLKELIEQHLANFKRDEQYDLFGYLQNYCIKQINSGNNNYLNELFSNYQSMIKNEVVINENIIAQFDFKNIVTVALRVEEYVWTNQFIQGYMQYLPEEHRGNAVAYNTARLHFYTKKYRNCLKELHSVEFTDIYYSLDSRALLLKTYYELEDFESALNLIKTFKIYLKRDNKISEYQNSTYSNFLKLTNNLVRYKLGYKKKIETIKKEIESTKLLADLTWLNNKVDELT